jgi:ribonuclease Z
MGRGRQSLLCVGIAWLTWTCTSCDRIESRLIERAAARALGGDRTDLLNDGSLHVVLCGTGSPLPDPERAGPCTAVLAGGEFFLVDVGPGSSREVAFTRLPRARLTAILITHLHSDHIGELGEAVVQSWIAGRGSRPVTVYGPPGIAKVVDGFRQAYVYDALYRVAHHGTEAMPPGGANTVAREITPPAPGEALKVYEGNGLRISAFAVDHPPAMPAYGYRFDYHGRSVVISGDTKKSDNLIQQAQGVDLLVHEALAAPLIEQVSQYARDHGLKRWAKMTTDVVTYHTTPVEAAQVAKAANVRMLVFTHIVPPLPNFVARRIFMQGVSSAWDGKVVLGQDGMHFRLAPDTSAVAVDTLS